MCAHRNSKIRVIRGKTKRLDGCIADDIVTLNTNRFIDTVASCCGHGIYPKTIVQIKTTGEIVEIFSNKVIPRIRRFYAKDEKGFFFIPEVRI